MKKNKSNEIAFKKDKEINKENLDITIETIVNDENSEETKNDTYQYPASIDNFENKNYNKNQEDDN